MPDALPSGRCTIPITTAIKLPSPPCCVVCVCARECESEKDRDMVGRGKLCLPTSRSDRDEQVVTGHVRLAPVTHCLVSQVSGGKEDGSNLDSSA